MEKVLLYHISLMTLQVPHDLTLTLGIVKEDAIPVTKVVESNS